MAEYKYIAPETQSLEQAKQIALQRAKIQAIADEFGTTVSQTNYTNIRNSKNESIIDFQSIGLSDLRGEWIETLKEPSYDITYSDGMQCVQVKVKGIIRRIDEDYARICTRILRNSPDLRFESSEFKNGDDLFLYFSSPVNGYLSVYLIDTEDNAFCLLPYARQADGVFEVEANREYVFFNQEQTTLNDKTLVDEYIMTCNGNTEFNRLAIVFSERKFIKSADTSLNDKLPRHLPVKEFNLWLAKARNKDIKMQYNELTFSIKP
ncbi:MAG: DUF4384 domain-containing protein [Muribaculaceae bacterium]|nr:DUF4384 domain-containing protein [Muribaculaceae bacterium]